MEIKGLQKAALLVSFVLMALNVIFDVKIGYMWMLVPFIIYAAITGWSLLRAIGALIFSFASKGWDKTEKILKENAEAQKELKLKSHETIEDCIKKLWN